MSLRVGLECPPHEATKDRALRIVKDNTLYLDWRDRSQTNVA